MDWINIRQRAGEALGKYKYALLILALGLVLMCFPEKDPEISEEAAPSDARQLTTASQLEQILEQIEGVGKVKAMLTEAAGETIRYQTDGDETISSDSESRKTETVIITDADRTQAGLIRQVDPPEYLGAIIVCQGGDRPSVCLAVTQAVADVTGLSCDHISVLKMK